MGGSSYRAAARCVRRAHPRLISPESLLSGVGRQLQPDEGSQPVRAPVRSRHGRGRAHYCTSRPWISLRLLRERGRGHSRGADILRFPSTSPRRCGQERPARGVQACRFQGVEAVTGDVAVEDVGDAKSDCGRKADLRRPTQLPRRRGEFVVALCVRDPSDAGTAAGQAEAQVGRHLVHGPKRHLAAGVDGGRSRSRAGWRSSDADAGILTADVDVSGDAGAVRIYVCDPAGRQVGAGAAFAEESRCRWGSNPPGLKRGRPVACAAARSRRGAPLEADDPCLYDIVVRFGTDAQLHRLPHGEEWLRTAPAAFASS